jgi:hypothetical protein
MKTLLLNTENYKVRQEGCLEQHNARIIVREDLATGSGVNIGS